MKPVRRHSREPDSDELAGLRARLDESQETLRAIRGGEVDTVVVAGKQGPQVFTLQGSEHAYRMLIESMNEGALTLTADGLILYANQCFARMVALPLERVMGSSFDRFLLAEDRATLRPFLKRAGKSGSKVQVRLQAGHGSQLPVLISLCGVTQKRLTPPTIGMVVTDMTDVRRTEELLRALTHRVVQAQESERGRVAIELHNGITQILCAILFRCQALSAGISAHDLPSKREAIQLREMIGEAAEEVERISRGLRVGVLDELGLVPVLRATSKEFADRTGVSIKLTCPRWTGRLHADFELTLYRILQEALRNVEAHARARHVIVRLKRQNGFVYLMIADDGIGFDPDHRSAGQKEKDGLGLLSMRERAAHMGGAIKIVSARRVGTKIEVRLPLPTTKRS